MYFYTTHRCYINHKIKSMKTLFINRHAKSSWKFENLNDFDRPLNERGNKSAAFMASKLKERGEKNLILSSPVQRTALYLQQSIFQMNITMIMHL